MKRRSVWTVGIIFILSSVVFAYTDSVQIPITVNVPGNFSWQVSVRHMQGEDDNPWDNDEVQEMSFDDFVWLSGYNVWMCDDWYTVLFIVNNPGTYSQWQITQSCDGIEDANNNNLNKTLIYQPDVQAADNGGFTPEGTVGDAGFVASQNGLIFSTTSGQGAVVRSYYYIYHGDPEQANPNDEAQPITINTPGGEYTGTVTFTFTGN